MFEVDIDIGRVAALHTDKAFEQQVELIGVDRGNPEHITHGRIRRRTSPLAEYLLLPGPAHDIPYREKIIGKIESFDQHQFMCNLIQYLRWGVLIETVFGALVSQFTQVGLRRVPVWNHFLRVVITQLVEVEYTGLI